MKFCYVFIPILINNGSQIRTKAKNIYYIGNLNPYIWADDGTADPAYYEIFMEIFNRFFAGNECSVQDGLMYAKKNLKEYNVIEHQEFSYNIDEVVEVFDKCTFSEWVDIYTLIKKQRKQ